MSTRTKLPALATILGLAIVAGSCRQILGIKRQCEPEDCPTDVVPPGCPDDRPSEGDPCSVPLGDICDFPDSEGECCPDGMAMFGCGEAGWEWWNEDQCSCDSPPPTCEEESPTQGAPCSVPDRSCTVDSLDPCCEASTYLCEEGVWQRSNEPACDLCPPSCPTTQPDVGTECKPIGQSCSFPDPEECCPNTLLTCTPGGRWQMVGEVVCAPLTECPSSTPAAGESCACYEAGLECPIDGSTDVCAAVCEADTWSHQPCIIQ